MNKRIKLFFIVLILFNLIAWFFVFYERDYLKVSFLNIGQGDSIFIETNKGYQILIDGGPDNTILKRLEEQMNPFDKEIDLVILTHPDKDHYGGLVGVFNTYKVDNLIWTGQENDSDYFKRFKAAIGDYTKVYAGDRVFIDNIVLDVLNPFYGIEKKNFNDNSIVCMLKYEDFKILLTGDITSKVESELMNEFEIGADILKVGHHGSKHSTSSEFIEKVKPEIAVIQVGKNSYGHPDKRVLNELEESGIKILRTDLDGSLIFYIKSGDVIFRRVLDF